MWVRFVGTGAPKERAGYDDLIHKLPSNPRFYNRVEPVCGVAPFPVSQ